MTSDTDAHSAKDIEYHRATAHLYDSVVHEPRRYANDLLFAGLDDMVPRGGHMLDLGSGTGHMLERYGKRFEHVTGVDHSAAMLAFAQAKVASHPDAELLEADIFAWARQATPGRYRFVSCVGCLHHLQAERVRELYRLLAPLLAPGGRLLLAEPVEVAIESLPAAVQAWNAGSVMVARADALHAIEVEEADEAPITLDVLKDWPGEHGLHLVGMARGWELFPHHLPPNWLDRMKMRRLHRRFGDNGNIVAVLWGRPQEPGP